MIVCEGATTETGYFDYIRVALRAATLNLEISGGHGDPLGVVQTAIKLRNRARLAARRERDAFLQYDEVWSVVDVDEHHHLPEALILAAREDVNMVVSNPCFELWAILHFADQTAYLSRGDAKKILTMFMPRYEKSLECSALKGYYEQARGRAIHLDKMHAAGGVVMGNPSSGAWRIVDSLIQSSHTDGGVTPSL